MELIVTSINCHHSPLWCIPSLSRYSSSLSFILSFIGKRWMWVVSHTPRPVHPLESWVGLKASLSPICICVYSFLHLFVVLLHLFRLQEDDIKVEEVGCERGLDSCLLRIAVVSCVHGNGTFEFHKKKVINLLTSWVSISLWTRAVPRGCNMAVGWTKPPVYISWRSLKETWLRPNHGA